MTIIDDPKAWREEGYKEYERKLMISWKEHKIEPTINHGRATRKKPATYDEKR